MRREYAREVMTAALGVPVRRVLGILAITTLLGVAGFGPVGSVPPAHGAECPPACFPPPPGEGPCGPIPCQDDVGGDPCNGPCEPVQGDPCGPGGCETVPPAQEPCAGGSCAEPEQQSGTPPEVNNPPAAPQPPAAAAAGGPPAASPAPESPPAEPSPSPSEQASPSPGESTEADARADSDGNGGGSAVPLLAAGAAVLTAGTVALAVRRRRQAG